MTLRSLYCAAVILFAGSFALVGLPAFAQQTAPDGSAKRSTETVVVTGQRELDAVISQFVDQHAAPNRKTGQYMRDDIGVICPITLGMPAEFDKFVTGRVLAVAASVGAKAGVDGACKPNVEILFTDQPRAVVKSLAERTHGAILGMHFLHETPQLLAVTHPIQAWYVTGTRMDENSAEPMSTIGADGQVTSGDDKTPVLDSAYHNGPDRVSTGSRLPGRRISSIMNVLIVADSTKVDGMEIGPISDYIAMLALSEPASLDDCSALPSILDLMVQSCGRQSPAALTENDIAYLKALYAADLGATTNLTQKQSIEGGMKAGTGK